MSDFEKSLKRWVSWITLTNYKLGVFKSGTEQLLLVFLCVCVCLCLTVSNVAAFYPQILPQQGRINMMRAN